MIVQRFDCGEGALTLSIEVFSPRTTASRLIGEQRRLTGGLEGEDVETHTLSFPDTPRGAWQLRAAEKSAAVVATSLWIDGQPARLGMTTRARQAWRSVFGAQLRPVLMVVTTDRDLLGTDATAREHAASRIVGFLRAQAGMTRLVAQLAGSPG
jgi:hypothetical protein